MIQEKTKSIEIPFGAKDSEFIKDEYYIPEGCEARIEGNKVIIEKIQKEELTEFEKELINLVFKYKYWDSSKDKVKQGIKKDSKLLLDLARKEILKDFPKWKKATEHLRGEGFIHYDNHSHRMTAEYAYTNVEGGEYYLSIDDLKTLPKEE